MTEIEEKYHKLMRGLFKEWLNEQEVANALLSNLANYGTMEDARWVKAELSRENNSIYDYILEHLNKMKVENFYWKWEVIGQQELESDPSELKKKLENIYNIFLDKISDS